MSNLERTENKESGIYVFINKDSVKVGFSKDIPNRLNTLSRWENELTLVKCYKGILDDEQRIHTYLNYSGEYLSREWYPISRLQEIIKYLDSFNFTKILPESEYSVHGKADKTRMVEGLLDLFTENLIRKENKTLKDYIKLDYFLFIKSLFSFNDFLESKGVQNPEAIFSIITKTIYSKNYLEYLNSDFEYIFNTSEDLSKILFLVCNEIDKNNSIGDFDTAKDSRTVSTKVREIMEMCK